MNEKSNYSDHLTNQHGRMGEKITIAISIATYRVQWVKKKITGTATNIAAWVRKIISINIISTILSSSPIP